MESLKKRWTGLSKRQRMIAVAGGATSVVLAAAMLRMSTATDEALLYAGLDPVASGEVIAYLDKEGIPYTVKGNGISVPAEQRDRLRLSLAAQNLPRPTSEGYELLDELDGFSTTSDMFSVTYWRAKEGELARTLMTIPGITAARVHIGTEDRNGFTRRTARRTASVTLTAPVGLDAEQIKAVRYLTALAVPNLPASDVAVIDAARGMVTEADELARATDNKREASLEQDLMTLLEARVGPGNARVNVVIDLLRQHEEVSEHTVDPDSATVVQQSRESSRSTEQGSERAVTIASDLPDGEEADNERSSETEDEREKTSFAVSTTDRRVERLPGGIRKVSVAVLLNEPAGGEPRTEAELEALNELVAAAAGLEPDRGDVLTIRSMPFEPVPDMEGTTAEEPGMLDRLPLGQLAQTGLVSFFALLFGLFVIRPLFGRRPSSEADDMPALELDAAVATEFLPEPARPDPVKLLQDRSTEKADAAATVLNAWLDDQEETAA